MNSRDQDHFLFNGLRRRLIARQNTRQSSHVARLLHYWIWPATLLYDYLWPLSSVTGMEVVVHHGRTVYKGPGRHPA